MFKPDLSVQVLLVAGLHDEELPFCLNRRDRNFGGVHTLVHSHSDFIRDVQHTLLVSDEKEALRQPGRQGDRKWE